MSSEKLEYQDTRSSEEQAKNPCLPRSELTNALREDVPRVGAGYPSEPQHTAERLLFVLGNEFTKQRELNRTLQSALSSSRAECEALRADAERYRWLKGFNSGSIGIYVFHMDPELERVLAGNSADEAIDQARQALEAKNV